MVSFRHPEIRHTDTPVGALARPLQLPGSTLRVDPGLRGDLRVHSGTAPPPVPGFQAERVCLQGDKRARGAVPVNSSPSLASLCGPATGHSTRRPTRHLRAPGSGSQLHGGHPTVLDSSDNDCIYRALTAYHAIQALRVKPRATLKQPREEVTAIRSPQGETGAL